MSQISGRESSPVVMAPSLVTDVSARLPIEHLKEKQISRIASHVFKSFEGEAVPRPLSPLSVVLHDEDSADGISYYQGVLDESDEFLELIDALIPSENMAMREAYARCRESQKEGKKEKSIEKSAQLFKEFYDSLVSLCSFFPSLVDQVIKTGDEERIFNLKDCFEVLPSVVSEDNNFLLSNHTIRQWEQQRTQEVVNRALITDVVVMSPTRRNIEKRFSVHRAGEPLGSGFTSIVQKLFLHAEYDTQKTEKVRAISRLKEETFRSIEMLRHSCSISKQLRAAGIPYVHKVRLVEYKTDIGPEKHQGALSELCTEGCLFDVLPISRDLSIPSKLSGVVA